MAKHFYIFIFLTSSVFSQEANIATKFAQDGNLYESLNDNSQTLAQFKENEKCIVTAFLGDYTYKIKYKDWIGFVTDEFLFVNESMMDLYFDHEKEQRKKAIEERKNRQKKIFEIVNKDSIVKAKEDKRKILVIQRRNDSLAKVKEDLRRALIAQKRSDSIVKIRETERLTLITKRRNDSIAIVKEKQRLASITKRKDDSITKIKENLRLALIAQKRNDSIVQVKETERLVQIALKRNDSISKAKENVGLALIAQRKTDSITKVKEDTRRKLAIQKRNDSLTNVRKTEQLKLIAQKRSDSTTKIKEKKEIERKQQIEKRRYDSIIKVRAQERKKLLKLRRKNDSISAIVEMERKELKELKRKDSIANTILLNNVKKNDSIAKIKKEEKIKFRNTCHYQINEYDKFYNITTIRTEPYSLSKNLTVELYKQGQKINVFFNFSEDLGCATYLPNNRSFVKVTLKNNQTISFYHSWDIDCDEFRLKANLSSSKIADLKKSPIKSITLKGTKTSKEILNIDYKEFFMDKLICLE